MWRQDHALRRRYGRAQPAIGRGAHGFILSHHKYAIVGLVPKPRHPGEYLKARHVIGRARDAHEALVQLYELQRSPGAAAGWDIIVLDLAAKQGKLTPVVTRAELEARKARGE